MTKTKTWDFGEAFNKRKMKDHYVSKRAYKWLHESGYDQSIQNWGIIIDAFHAGFRQAEKKYGGQ